MAGMAIQQQTYLGLALQKSKVLTSCLDSLGSSSPCMSNKVCGKPFGIPSCHTNAGLENFRS